jgi:hypothetical protein
MNKYKILVLLINTYITQWRIQTAILGGGEGGMPYTRNVKEFVIAGCEWLYKSCILIFLGLGGRSTIEYHIIYIFRTCVCGSSMAERCTM